MIDDRCSFGSIKNASSSRAKLKICCGFSNTAPQKVSGSAASVLVMEGRETGIGVLNPGHVS